MSQQRARIIYIDTCAQCGSETERTTTALTYNLDGLTITVDNVPASVCHSCGEKYIPGDAGIAINRQVRKFADSARESSVTEGRVVLTADLVDPKLEQATP